MLASILGLAIGLAGAPALADPPRADDISTYSSYEQETVKIALDKVGGALEPSPDGKVVEGVDFVTLEPFEKRDPIPNKLNGFVNWFHVVSKPRVIERELLIHRGDVYSRALVEETARNLRALPQLSVVILLPTKGSASDRIRLLVITKDLWSLRWPIDPLFTSSGALESLVTQLLEINLFGTHNQLAANFSYDPNTISFGATFVAPRIYDSRYRFTADVNPIINYRTGDLEGSYGSFSYGKPLYSLATEWSYGASIGWSTDVARRYIAAKVSVYDADSGKCVSPRDADGNVVPGVPCAYSRDRESGRIYVTRSFGRAVKHNITLSAEASRAVYRPLDLSQYDPKDAADFKSSILPVSDTRLGPALRYQTYTPRYHRILDAERMGLQEEYQLGHNFIVRVQPAYAPLRDSRFVVGLYAGASYTVAVSDGFLRGYVESTTDFEPQRIPDGSIDVGTRIMSPRTWFGRAVVDSRFLYRYANYLNVSDTLGGSGRLRGYPSNSFRGQDVFAVNVELRSRPLEILSCQIGGVLFFDAGDAFNGFSDFDLKRSAGFGIRAMFPQINRIVFRADWGFPLESHVQGQPQKAFPGEIAVTFGQAFGVPAVPVGQSSE